MGVHREHRGHGYGRAITVAAAAVLQDLGSSSAIVCNPELECRRRDHVQVSRRPAAR
jgi:GNAT superfamily N-acetyltransferase